MQVLVINSKEEKAGRIHNGEMKTDAKLRAIFLVCFIIISLPSETLARRRSRSMLKVEELETSKEFLIKFINSHVQPPRQFCRGKFIRQIISHPGCVPKAIINKMCYGMCKSAYVPEVRGNKPQKTMCVQCQPASALWMTVTLKCPGQKRRYVYKKVRKIKKCHCWSNRIQVPMRMIPNSKSIMKVMAWLKGFR